MAYPSVDTEQEGLRLVTRERHPEDTVLHVGTTAIGNGNFSIIAGPCAVESETQILACAEIANALGADILRGGCFKARTSPYAFQGLGIEGLQLLSTAGRAYSLPIVTEVLNEELVDQIASQSDILQIGARNMQNYALLRAVGRVRRPVLLKRGMSASLEELLYAAEYILSEGNPEVILCERGIRTFENETRYTLDISAIPVLKLRTHLPIFVDPSHAAGRADIVIPLALAAKAAGAHGVMVEIHPSPAQALSDGNQALDFEQFKALMQQLRPQS